MSQLHASLPLRKQVNRILKLAEEQASEAKVCRKCGSKIVDGKCKCSGENESENESQGYGGIGGADMGSGMDVTASAAFTYQLQKLGSALDYAAENIYELVDDRPVAEKLAELAAFQTQVNKIAAGELGTGESEMGEGNQLKNTLSNDGLQRQEQVTPHKGKQMIPHATPVSSQGELETNASDDRTGEEWTDYPMKSKKASVAFRRMLQKRAQGIPPGAPAAPMAPAPAPAPAAPMAPPPAAPMAPAPPPPPDPRTIAAQLQAQGSLTPESLAGAAGVSVEEAAAIIASMTGGTGVPQAPPVAAPAAAVAPPEAAAAPAPQAGGGGPGMAVQASADPSALFQSALRKIAGEDMSTANISGSKGNARPEEESLSPGSLPGSEGLASNEAAIAFTAQQGRKPRDEAITAVLNNKVPYKAESGKLTGGPGKADEMLGDKTSAARAIVSRLGGRRRRPL